MFEKKMLEGEWFDKTNNRTLTVTPEKFTYLTGGAAPQKYVYDWFLVGITGEIHIDVRSSFDSTRNYTMTVTLTGDTLNLKYNDYDETYTRVKKEVDVKKFAEEFKSLLGSKDYNSKEIDIGYRILDKLVSGGNPLDVIAKTVSLDGFWFSSAINDIMSIKDGQVRYQNDPTKYTLTINEDSFSLVSSSGTYTGNCIIRGDRMDLNFSHGPSQVWTKCFDATRLNGRWGEEIENLDSSILVYYDITHNYFVKGDKKLFIKPKKDHCEVVDHNAKVIAKVSLENDNLLRYDCGGVIVNYVKNRDFINNTGVWKSQNGRDIIALTQHYLFENNKVKKLERLGYSWVKIDGNEMVMKLVTEDVLCIVHNDGSAVTYSRLK